MPTVATYYGCNGELAFPGDCKSLVLAGQVGSIPSASKGTLQIYY